METFGWICLGWYALSAVIAIIILVVAYCVSNRDFFQYKGAWWKIIVIFLLLTQCWLVLAFQLGEMSFDDLPSGHPKTF